MSDYPAYLPIKVQTNQTKKVVFTWTVNGVPVDNTGWHARLQVRWVGSDSVAATFSDLDYITLHGVSGMVTADLNVEVNSTLSAGVYEYDFLMIDLNGDPTPIWRGPYEVVEGVTTP